MTLGEYTVACRHEVWSRASSIAEAREAARITSLSLGGPIRVLGYDGETIATYRDGRCVHLLGVWLPSRSGLCAPVVAADPPPAQMQWEWRGEDPPPTPASDTALSPPWVAEWLGDWPDLDPCAHPAQLVCARVRLCEVSGHDGLAVDWTTYGDGGHVRVWLQPPYSAPAPWVDRAIDVIRSGRGSVAAMLRGDVTTRATARLLDVVRSRGGWAGLTRERLGHGAVSPDGQVVQWTDPGKGRYGSLLLSAGQEAIDPPAGLWMLALPPVVVPVAVPVARVEA